MKTWIEASKVYLDRKVIIILFFGFSSGLPFLLVFSTLSVWLESEEVSLGVIGFFSLVRIPYTFKFLWAPLIDRLPLPLLDKAFGRRRSWALFTQALLMAAIFGMSLTSPGENYLMTALFSLLVAFCSASQDIVIDAFRVDSLEKSQQGAGAGIFVLGYRTGMLCAGAGSLWLAALLTWPQIYMTMAALTAVGMTAILCAGEPKADSTQLAAGDEEKRLAALWSTNYPKQMARMMAWSYEAVWAPFKDFMRRPDWSVILPFIMLYKLGEAYLGAMANPFYLKMGFSAAEIANVSKIFGLGATLLGALAGGIMVSRQGIMQSLMICGVLQVIGSLLYCFLALAGHNVPALVLTIAADNVAGGMATSAFVAYLSSLCSQAYTATQYALLSSLTAFARDVLSSSSGMAAEFLGWVGFFLFSSAIAVPGLLLLFWLIRRQAPDQSP